MASPSSSSSVSASSKKHEVYISVQKDDAGKFITDMIDTSLAIHQVPTYKDEKQLRAKQRGTNLGRELKEAIWMAKISIVLLSNDYFGSSWCLEELYAIVEGRKRWGLIVLPIFFEVDPSDVRKQRGDAGKVVSIQRKEGVWYRRWKLAMKTAADLIGWDHRGNNRLDSVLIGKLVEDIKNKRIPTNLSISIYPLRYDTFGQYLNLFLQTGMDGVLMVGICGGSGLGKTAIAKAVYDEIFDTFEGRCFVTNVGQNSRRPDGLVQLQEQLLASILQDSSIFGIKNPVRGMDLIKEKLCFKRVLIMLDDVDELDQLYALVGGRNWFGLGSKIIVTARNLYLLNAFGFDQIFLAQGLPLPPDLQAILKPFQRSQFVIARLKEHIQILQQLAFEREKNLEQQLQEERQKNAIQAKLITQLQQVQQSGSRMLQ